MYQTSSDLRIGGLGTPDVVPWFWKSSTKADAEKCWKPFFYAHMFYAEDMFSKV